MTTLTRLTEYVVSERALAVDPAAGVIKSVKVLGHHSRNGRTYAAEALRKAAGLYEGRVVNVNHPAKPTDPRSAYDRFGELRNVRAGDGGLYADLHYLTTHPLAAAIAEAAARMPSLFGLSHVADGKTTVTREGKVHVAEIRQVFAVDVVADPATVSSLFEQRTSPPTATPPRGETPVPKKPVKAFAMTPERLARYLKAGSPKERSTVMIEAARETVAETPAEQARLLAPQLQTALRNMQGGQIGAGDVDTLKKVAAFLDDLADDRAAQPFGGTESRLPRDGKELAGQLLVERRSGRKAAPPARLPQSGAELAARLKRSA